MKKDLEILLKILILFFSFYFLSVYLYLGLKYVLYPLEIDWLEGAVLQHAKRVLWNEPIYTAPHMEFVPFLYNPLYYYLSAFLLPFTGINLLGPRLISFISFLFSLVLIYYWIKKETGKNFWAFIATGIWAASSPLTGGFYSLARVDSLFIFLLLTALYQTRWMQNKKDATVAGLLFCLSYFTKQQALPVLLALLIYVFVEKRKFFIPFVTSSLGLIIILSILLNKISQGWYFFYTWYLPLHHEKIKKMVILFWTIDILHFYAFAFLLSIIFLTLTFSKRNKFYFYLLTIAGMIFTSWISRVHRGGSINVLIPAYAILTIGFTLGAAELYKLIHRFEKKAAAIILFTVFLQNLLLYVDPLPFIPTQKRLQKELQYLKTLATFPGNIYIESSCYLPLLLGRKPYAHVWAIIDILRTNPKPVVAQILVNELQEKIKKKFFSAIGVSRGYFLPRVINIEDYYKKKKVKFALPSLGYSRQTIWPEIIYLPKNISD